MKVKLYKDGSWNGCYAFDDTDDRTKVMAELPAGVYILETMDTMMGSFNFYRPLPEIEQYVPFSNGAAADIMERAGNFFSGKVKSKYDDLGLAYKTGIILHGKSGTGKTVMVKIIMKELSRLYGAICIVGGTTVKPLAFLSAIQELKTMNKPIVLFVDECEYSLNQFESYWLTILDGYLSPQNFMFLGCTNYLGDISPRLRRPSRIAHCIEISSIDEEVAKQYVESKVGKFLDANTRAMMVIESQEQKATIDAFKHAIKEFYIYGDGTHDCFRRMLKDQLTIEDGERREDEE